MNAGKFRGDDSDEEDNALVSSILNLSLQGNLDIKELLT